MTDQADPREAEFFERLDAGEDVEAGDWMPDSYRTAVRRFIEMHGNSELMGALPERDWIVRAPTLQRKLALTARCRTRSGHAQLLLRLVEDLGKPREEILADLLEGRSKFHNVFHYPTRSWGDIGVIAWLVDAAAILSQKALLKTLLPAVSPRHDAHLLGGVVPRPARARRRAGAGHGATSPSARCSRRRSTAGGSR